MHCNSYETDLSQNSCKFLFDLVALVQVGRVVVAAYAGLVLPCHGHIQGTVTALGLKNKKCIG